MRLHEESGRRSECLAIFFGPRRKFALRLLSFNTLGVRWFHSLTTIFPSLSDPALSCSQIGARDTDFGAKPPSGTAIPTDWIFCISTNKFSFMKVRASVYIREIFSSLRPLPDPPVVQTNHWTRLSPSEKPRRRHFLGICGRKEVISFKSGGSYSLMRKFLHFTSAGIVSEGKC